MMQRLEQIAEQIRLATGFDIAALRSQRRDRMCVAARQLFCYYACREGYTQTDTAAYIDVVHNGELSGMRLVGF
jgi:hypothetical protein